MNVITGASRYLASTLAAAAFLASGAACAQSGSTGAFLCGPLSPPGQYGPFDYRTLTPEVKHRVEDYHFTPIVEQGLGGQNGPFGGDVDYTLRAFPNSPRALLAIERFSMSHHTEHAPGAKYSTECYFDRAIRFQPNDPMVHLIYAIYLRDHKRAAESRGQLDEAERLRGDPSNFDIDYNLGLLYYDIGAYDKSMDAAERAYALGAPLPALMNKLKSVKKWRDPAPRPAAPADAGPANAGPATAVPAAQPPADAQPHAD